MSVHIRFGVVFFFFVCFCLCFFFNDTATTEIYTLSLHDALPIFQKRINPNLKLFGIALTMYQKSKLCNTVVDEVRKHFTTQVFKTVIPRNIEVAAAPSEGAPITVDRKSTRLNSSHWWISYAVFCLKKKNTHTTTKEKRNFTTTAAHHRYG